MARFWSKVAKSDGCWQWTANTNTSGYGQIFASARDIGSSARHGHRVYAHRLSWELHSGPIPDGLWVLHRCDNKICVRPDHLFLGTQAENNADMFRKGRGNFGITTGPKGPRPQTRGEGNHSAKLTWAQVADIRSLAASGTRFTVLAAQFGVHRSSIRRIVRGEVWRT